MEPLRPQVQIGGYDRPIARHNACIAHQATMSITVPSPLLASCVPPPPWGAIGNRERNHRTLTGTRLRRVRAARSRPGTTMAKRWLDRTLIGERGVNLQDVRRDGLCRHTHSEHAVGQGDVW